MFQRLRSGSLVFAIVAMFVVVVVVFLYAAQQVGNLKTEGLVVTAPISPGQMVTSKDVARVNISLGGQPIKLLASLPSQPIAAVAMSPGTLLQASDLVSQSLAQVSIQVQHSPAVVAGDTIDIYLYDAGESASSGGGTPTTAAPGSVVLIGVAVPVTSVNGTGLTILVPFKEASAWASVSADGPQLVAVTATTKAAPPTKQTNLKRALANLEAQAKLVTPGK